MAKRRRFPIRFSSGNSILMRGLLILPSSSYVDLDDHVTVRVDGPLAPTLAAVLDARRAA